MSQHQHSTTSQHQHYTTSQQQHNTTSQHQHYTTSQQQHNTTSQHQHYTTSQQQHNTTSQHQHYTTSQHQHYTTSQHQHYTTTSHHIITTTSHHTTSHLFSTTPHHKYHTTPRPASTCWSGWCATGRCMRTRASLSLELAQAWWVWSSESSNNTLPSTLYLISILPPLLTILFPSHHHLSTIQTPPYVFTDHHKNVLNILNTNIRLNKAQASENYLDEWMDG